jgi:hypothetical protein
LRVTNDQLRRWLLTGTLLFVVAGLLVSATSLLADDKGHDLGAPKEKLPPPWARAEPTKVPRPSESAAMSVDAAKRELSSISDIDEVIKAAEAADTEALLALAKSGDYCARKDFRGFVPPECASGRRVDGVYVEGGGFEPVLGPADRIRKALDAILGAQPVRMDFGSRDARFGQGNGGRYYLVFRASSASPVEGTLYDAVGMVVRPGEPEPIEWFIFIIPEGNGLTWVQERIDADGGFHQVLIAPESVKDWPGLAGEKGD